MAKASSIQKNISRSKLIDKFSNRRKQLKSKIKDKKLSIEERIKLQNKLNDLPRNVMGKVTKKELQNQFKKS